jgi:BMFP domain-containing protein YqiC
MERVATARSGETIMQGGNKILDDFARMMTDAAGMAQGVRREAEGVFKSQFERMIRDMDLVTREEFEAVRDMAVKAREENDALSARLAALEAQLPAGNKN